MVLKPKYFIVQIKRDYIYKDIAKDVAEDAETKFNT